VTIKLRIPIYLFSLGLISGAFQLASRSFQDVSNLAINFAFFIVIGFIFYTVEKVKLSEKETHVSLGILLIILGVAADYFMR